LPFRFSFIGKGFHSLMLKDAYKFALPPLAAGALCLIPGWRLLAAILIFLSLFVFYFFRDPERTIPSSPDAVVSPADGHVVQIADELLNGVMGHRISIFLAIWDVHVQRAPVAGRIASVVYQPGKFYAAMRSSASVENEQNIITIETPAGSLVFKQIAGAIARRVICWKSEGEIVSGGERLGLIRFGSRVDIWLPMQAEIVVQRGQKVKGGESLLAKWNSTA
jgi:phosphatidylserine decarboxylase